MGSDCVSSAFAACWNWRALLSSVASWGLSFALIYAQNMHITQPVRPCGARTHISTNRIKRVAVDACALHMHRQADETSISRKAVVAAASAQTVLPFCRSPRSQVNQARLPRRNRSALPAQCQATVKGKQQNTEQEQQQSSTKPKQASSKGSVSLHGGLLRCACYVPNLGGERALLS